MAKTKSRRRRYFGGRSRTYHARKMTIPLAVVAGFVPTAVGVWNRRASGTEVANYLQAGFTGIGTDGKFNLANLRVGLVPVLAGFGVHKIASMFGVNRAIGRSGIPFIRI